MGLFVNLHVLRATVSQLLVAVGHRRKLYSFEDVALALNLSANLDRRDDITRRLDAPLLAHAFSNGGLKEYSLSYKDSFGTADDTHLLFVSLPTQVGSYSSGTRTWSQGYLGCFPLEEIARGVDVSRLNVWAA